MKQSLRFTTGVALLAGVLLSLPAMAIQDFAEDAAPPAGGFVGLGVRSGPDYEGSDEYEATVAPFGYYRWESGRYVSLTGTSGVEKAGRLKANVVTAEQGDGWELGPLLQYRKKRDDVENNKVDKLNEVDAAVEAGAFVGFKSGNLALDVSFAMDVSSEHNGYLWYLNGRYKIPVTDKFSLTMGAHLTWADDDFMEEYFGVTGGESAKSGLPKYKASSGFKDTGLGLTGVYRFNKTWGIAANVGYTRMLNDAEDSPLVSKAGDENQYEAVVAVIYSF